MIHLYFVRHAESLSNINHHLIGGRSNHIPLTDKEGMEILHKLLKPIEYTKYELVLKPDLSLLGGFILEFNSQRIDMSIKGAIKQLSNYMDIPFSIS